MKRRNGTAMPDTMTRGPRTGQQRTVVPRGPSPIVATAVFLTSLVVVVCVVVAAVLLWRAPRDGNDAAADAQAPAAESAAEGVGEVTDAATSLGRTQTLNGSYDATSSMPAATSAGVSSGLSRAWSMRSATWAGVRAVPGTMRMRQAYAAPGRGPRSRKCRPDGRRPAVGPSGAGEVRHA